MSYLQMHLLIQFRLLIFTTNLKLDKFTLDKY